MYTSKVLKSIVILAVVAGCQGMPSEKPPIHVNPNMDWQERFNAQQENPFFEDNRSDRLPVEGTVSRGGLKADLAYYEGVTENGNYVSRIPVELNRAIVERGKERYQIFCTMCHGGTGAGDGIVIGYGYVPPPSFNEDRILNMPDGELYSAIYNGVRSMPSYRHQIPVEDRWAIVAYIRALQRSQNATPQDLERLGVDVEIASGISKESVSHGGAAQ